MTPTPVYQSCLMCSLAYYLPGYPLCSICDPTACVRGTFTPEEAALLGTAYRLGSFKGGWTLLHAWHRVGPASYVHGNMCHREFSHEGYAVLRELTKAAEKAREEGRLADAAQYYVEWARMKKRFIESISTTIYYEAAQYWKGA